MPRPSLSPDLIAYIDGASRGNPGPAAYAVVIKTGDGATINRLAENLGRATNNVAEYRALVAALEYALARRERRVKVVSDSELLVRQIQGAYKVRNPELKLLYGRAREMIGRLERFSIEHVPRERNRAADRLANEVLDARQAPD